MIGHSLPEYVFIRLSILGLRLIAPLSIAYVAISWYLHRWIYSKWLGYYALVESIFYLCVYLPRSRLMQQVSSQYVGVARPVRSALRNHRDGIVAIWKTGGHPTSCLISAVYCHPNVDTTEWLKAS